MIPAGYMAKTVCRNPDWLNEQAVRDIYSVSNCFSKPFADAIDCWQHNGFCFFDSPATIARLAVENAISLAETTLFY